MPIKVSLNENECLILIESSGALLRREAGWGAERVRELLSQHPISAVLFDSSQIQKHNSPSLSGEIISGFIQAIESDVLIAYVRPNCWDEAYLSQVATGIEDIPARSRVFENIDTARAWLRDETGCKAAPA
ncbi:hypothetical protein [uncultured Maricaulis sp.]|uniref:hypothetical protein n=1 Tax=uncultured Maricaulis sp. TaxID=174710 RepID=UPI0030D9D5F6|tara:strand:- start:73262 stop:73654 length:393 start_codon:yes stop_codon:yes gene_type:complete